MSAKDALAAIRKRGALRTKTAQQKAAQNKLIHLEDKIRAVPQAVAASQFQDNVAPPLTHKVNNTQVPRNNYYAPNMKWEFDPTTWEFPDSEYENTKFDVEAAVRKPGLGFAGWTPQNTNPAALARAERAFGQVPGVTNRIIAKIRLVRGTKFDRVMQEHLDAFQAAKEDQEQRLKVLEIAPDADYYNNITRLSKTMLGQIHHWLDMLGQKDATLLRRAAARNK